MPSKPLARPMITWESAASSSYSCGASVFSYCIACAGSIARSVAPRSKESQRPRRASSGFFYQDVACCDHELVDLVEQLRGEQADVVFEGLEVIADIIKGTMKVHVLTG